MCGRLSLLLVLYQKPSNTLPAQDTVQLVGVLVKAADVYTFESQIPKIQFPHWFSRVQTDIAVLILPLLTCPK